MNEVEQLNYDHLKARIKELEDDIKEKEETQKACEEEHRQLLLKYKQSAELNKTLAEKVDKLEQAALNLFYVMKKFR